MHAIILSNSRPIRSAPVGDVHHPPTGGSICYQPSIPYTTTYSFSCFRLSHQSWATLNSDFGQSLAIVSLPGPSKCQCHFCYRCPRVELCAPPPPFLRSIVCLPLANLFAFGMSTCDTKAGVAHAQCSFIHSTFSFPFFGQVKGELIQQFYP